MNKIGKDRDAMLADEWEAHCKDKDEAEYIDRLAKVESERDEYREALEAIKRNDKTMTYEYGERRRSRPGNSKIMRR